MNKSISWSELDMAIRLTHDFVVQSHRYVREGCPEKGMHGPLFVRIEAIRLRNVLNNIIDDA